LNDDLGAPQPLPRAVALYERDGGLLWKHFDIDSGKTESRRARELDIAMVFTVGNYDYGMAWIFRQDGSLSFEATPTGIVLAKGVEDTACTACAELSPKAGPLTAVGSQKYATLVAKNIVAPNHQHFFNMRLDLDVDGAANGVVEMNSYASPQGPKNPNGNAFYATETVLDTERAAQREQNATSFRHWAVYNPTEKTALGHLPAYVLEPGPSITSFLSSDSPVRKRARFLDHTLWATCRKDDELHAAGEYPNQSSGGEGLPRFAQDDERLTGQDVVLWYTFGVHHLPRPEDWPVMPAIHVGFTLAPRAFFVQSPALDAH
jgi:primary-amine oxidase